MNIQSLLKGAQVLVKTNSPSILTGLAVAGTVTSAFLAAKAGWQAGQVIQEAEQRLDNPITGPVTLTAKERAKIVWPLFIPAVGVGTLSVVCALSSNHVSSKRVAAFTSAYTLTEKAFSEYQEKVAEQLGVNKEQKVRDAVAQDRVTENPPNREVLIVENGDVVCYDMMLGRYFKSTVEKIRKAQNDINQEIINNMYASLNDFWGKLDIPQTPMGDEVGWNTELLLEIDFSSTLDPEGRPVLAISYANMPRPGYYNLSI